MTDNQFKSPIFFIKDIYGKEFKLDSKELIIKQSGPAYIVKRGNKEIVITQKLIDDKLTHNIKIELEKLI